ncbi:unnamed protein product [Ilex paraguariensis]|uniref:Uncharacterized protein n=1 Tax=Ilex paraguariensis TaxID=185542 RepID=A0ABC8TJW5_9AQUA
MASTAISLQLRPKHRPFRNPNFLHYFSSSTPDPNAEPQNPTTSTSSSSSSSSQSQSQASFSSYFSDVKASLKHQSPPQPPRKPFSLSSPSNPPQAPPSKVAASLEEIRKNLSEFRRRSAAPLPDDKSQSSSQSSRHISFQELYKRNVISKGEDSNTNEASKGGGKLSFDAIRESLRHLRSQKNQGSGGNTTNDPMSLSRFKESFKLRPVDPSVKESPVVIGGSDRLPSSVFGKEMREKKETEVTAMTTEFLRMYSYGDLGQKLRMLRPEVAKKETQKNWFSLAELNERLMKLREIEEKESESRIGGISFKELRESLAKLQISDAEKARKTSMERLNVLGTASFMLAPPKEHLVEKYFHPDNMSSSEKMKLELKKVRDELKMSESDCGSFRVQGKAI